jgi:uncharacterized protein (TIGR02001 family)
MTKIFWVSSVTALLFSYQAALAAPGDSSSTPQFDFGVTAATDYIFRGVSQTENGPAVFGTARVSLDQFYAGAGIENVDFHNSTNAEYDLSAGWTPSVSGFNLDLGIIRYGYADEPSHTHIDTVEFKGAASHDIGPVTIGAAVFYTTDYFGSGGSGTYVEARAAYSITDALSVNGAIGRQSVSDGIDHATWNVGLGYAITKNIGIDLRYYDTDEHSLGGVYGSHLVAAIKGSF